MIFVKDVIIQASLSNSHVNQNQNLEIVLEAKRKTLAPNKRYAQL